MMIAGGINYFGLSKLIFLEGTMNEFSYGQALLFYKDDIQEIEKNIKSKLYSSRMEQQAIKVRQISFY